MNQRILFIWCALNMQNFLFGWQNWAENQQCLHAQVITPRNLDELKTVIKNASAEHKHIRAVGSGHSWSAIVCTDIIIDTQYLNRVLEIDSNKKTIKVEAGIKIKDLVERLAQAKLVLPNQPAVLEQSAAGTISTATHGTGHTGTMADFVIALELLTADGTLLKLSKAENPALFAAAQVSIGSLGIIYSITFACESLFFLKRNQLRIPWAEFKQNIDSLYHNHDFLWVYFDIETQQVTLDILDRVNTSAHGISKDKEVSYKALSGKPSPYYLEEEIAVARTDMISAINTLIPVLKKYKADGVDINGILCRFVKADTSLLSPSTGYEVVFLSLITVKAHEKTMAFFQEAYRTLLKFNGRPHWGKLFFATQEDIKKLYGGNYDKFVAIRKQLDPNGLFSNAFTRTIFGW